MSRFYFQKWKNFKHEFKFHNTLKKSNDKNKFLVDSSHSYGAYSTVMSTLQKKKPGDREGKEFSNGITQEISDGARIQSQAVYPQSVGFGALFCLSLSQVLMYFLENWDPLHSLLSLSSHVARWVYFYAVTLLAGRLPHQLTSCLKAGTVYPDLPNV